MLSPHDKVKPTRQSNSRLMTVNHAFFANLLLLVVLVIQTLLCIYQICFQGLTVAVDL